MKIKLSNIALVITIVIDVIASVSCIANGEYFVGLVFAILAKAVYDFL